MMTSPFRAYLGVSVETQGERHISRDINFVMVALKVLLFLLQFVFGFALVSVSRPVQLRINKEVTGNATIIDSRTKNVDKDWLLEKYMQLPASQYAVIPLPLNSTLQRVFGSDEEFILSVPEISFRLPSGPIKILPKVTAQVNVTSDQVLIKSTGCTISSPNPIIEKLKLNDRYTFDVRTTLTWDRYEIPDVNSTSIFHQDVIMAVTDLKIDIYPPGKFSLVPKRVLEKVGNMAISYVTGLLLRDFMTGLVDDFERWARDDSYRQQRMMLEEEVQKELQSIRSFDPA